MRRVFTAAAAAILIVFALSGCEYLEGEPEPTLDPADPAAPRIGGIITAALSSYTTYGPETIYPLLAPEVALVCSQEEFVADMADAGEFGQLRMMKSIDYQGDGTARVNLVIITTEGDVEQTWTMKLGLNNIWKILDVPGMSDCKVA
jgi:hypothetical protein